MDNPELASSIRNAALHCGFDDCGIIPIKDMEGSASVFAERIRNFPNSKELYEPLSHWADPAKAAPWAKSIIVCVSWFGKYRIPSHFHGTIAKVFCVDSREDPGSEEYQVKKRFEGALDGMGIRHDSQSSFGITCLRWAAAKAGVGIIRKNNFLYTERGSWCIIEAFLIDRELELKATPTIKPCPENCTRCIDSCPTGALSAPFQTNGVHCVTFLLNFDTCSPGRRLYEKCGTWIYGCDVCQDSCPFNKNAWSEEDEFPGLEELGNQISYEKILAMDYSVMLKLLPAKYWYIQPDDIWKWKCNVLNAMLNSYEAKYLPHIEQALHDTKAEVRSMAQWVLEQVAKL